MGAAYCSVEELALLWRPLTEVEAERAAALLPLVSDMVRSEAAKEGKDMDSMAEANDSYASVVKLVVCDVVGRILRQSTTGEAMSQESQSALGYTWSGTYAIPGGGMAGALLKNDLKRLGLRRQMYGYFDPYGVEGAQ